jgi:hypothetical protein
MAKVVREGPILRVVLVNGGTPDPDPVVDKVKDLLDEEVAEVVIELPGSDVTPDQPLVADVIQELATETLARGVPLRFSL